MLRLCWKSLLISVLLLLVLTYIALYVRDQFVRPFLGDVLVVIWLYYSLKSVLNVSVNRLALGVLFIAYAVELAQYFNVIAWLGLEHIKAVRIIFGATFDPLDLLAYTLGAFAVIGGNVAYEKFHKGR